MQPTTSIKLSKHSIETQFVFFYNIGAQIQKFTTPSEDQNFEKRNLLGSRLYESAFFDNPIPIICAVHFHAKDDYIVSLNQKVLGNTQPPIKLSRLPCTYYREFSTHNTDADKFTKKLEEVKDLGFSPLEFTLFKNGILAVTLRLTNEEELDDFKYVELITRSKQIDNKDDLANLDDNSCSMMKLAGKIMNVIEQNLVNYLNKHQMTGISLATGKEEEIRFHCTKHNSNFYETEKIDDLNDAVLNSFRSYKDGRFNFHTCLITTTPFIGTVIDLSNRHIGRQSENKTAARIHREREMQLALACARITKEFLDNFNDPELYLERELPRRNLYHPGPSIVFVGRRGWACIVREDRDSKSFQLHVIEIVLLVITSILASTKYTRDFIKRVTEEGDEKGKKFLYEFQNEKNKVKIDVNSIVNFANFVSRIKLGLPHLNLGILLSSHISTHTGIAAIRRLKYLTKHDDLVLAANNLVENYNSFFTSIDEIWKTKQFRINKRLLIVGIASIFISIATTYCAMTQKNEPTKNCESTQKVHAVRGQEVVASQCHPIE